MGCPDTPILAEYGPKEAMGGDVCLGLAFKLVSSCYICLCCNNHHRIRATPFTFTMNYYMNGRALIQESHFPGLGTAPPLGWMQVDEANHPLEPGTRNHPTKSTWKHQNWWTPVPRHQSCDHSLEHLGYSGREHTSWSQCAAEARNEVFLGQVMDIPKDEIVELAIKK